MQIIYWLKAVEYTRQLKVMQYCNTVGQILGEVSITGKIAKSAEVLESYARIQSIYAHLQATD